MLAECGHFVYPQGNSYDRRQETKMLASFMSTAVGMVESVASLKQIATTMTSSPNIGEIILNELARRDRSLTWLAKELDISVKSLHRYLNNPSRFRVGHLYNICHILEIDLFYCYSSTLTTEFYPKLSPPHKTKLSK